MPIPIIGGAMALGSAVVSGAKAIGGLVGGAAKGAAKRVPGAQRLAAAGRYLARPGMRDRFRESWFYDSLIDTIESSLPSQTRMVEVHVDGGPRSDLQSLYLVCLSLAFGTISRTVKSSDCAIDVMIDHTGKNITCKLSFQYSGVLANTQSLFSSDSGAGLIRTPPPQKIFGADYPDFLAGGPPGIIGSGIRSLLGPLTRIDYTRLNQQGGTEKVSSQHLPGADAKSPFITNEADFSYQPFSDTVMADRDIINMVTQVLEEHFPPIAAEPTPKDKYDNVLPSGLTYQSRFSNYFDVDSITSKINV